MRVAIVLVSGVFAGVTALCGAASAAQPKGLFFRTAGLAGWWGESFSTAPACDRANFKMRYDFASDGRRVRIEYDRQVDTDAGPMRGIDATVLSSTATSIVIRYDGEQRLNDKGQPVEWELAIVAPGVYRWRETSWEPGNVNIVVGIRCSR